MHIRVVETGTHGQRIAFDIEGDLLSVARRIVADNLGCHGKNVGAIQFGSDAAIVFSPAGVKQHRLEGQAAQELKGRLAVLYPVLSEQ